jgi:hypothetical protein
MAAVAAAVFSGLIWPCTGAAAALDASTVDVLVAIAAAAIVRGSVVAADDAGAATISVTATGAAIATATGAVAAA